MVSEHITAGQETYTQAATEQEEIAYGLPVGFLGCVTYTHKENASEKETEMLALLARTLDNMRGATIITHPMAWITNPYGIQSQGTVAFIFGTRGHREILERVIHDIHCANVTSIVFTRA